MKKFLLVFVGLLFTFYLAACESKESLKVFIWGEYIDEDIVADFEDEYNVNVDIIIFESNEIAVTQIKDSSFDVIVPSDYAIEELAVGEGFVEVADNKVSVLIDLAIGEEAIDVAKVEEAMKRAEEALAGENVDHDEMAALQAVIAKSEAMLRLKRKRM